MLVLMCISGVGEVWAAVLGTVKSRPITVRSLACCVCEICLMVDFCRLSNRSYVVDGGVWNRYGSANNMSVWLRDCR